MNYKIAQKENTEQIYQLVQNTVKTIYAQYYPKGVVDFFCKLHSRESISADIENGAVRVLFIGDCLVGTGSCVKNHISRLFVVSDLQGKGYGTYIMQCLENEIAANSDTVCLDASLPATKFYEHRGYKTIKHGTEHTDDGDILVYEIMEKQLHITKTDICYEGKFFVPKVNAANGEVDNQTLFTYHQNGNVMWADYFGGEIKKGNMIGFVSTNGELDFYYQHINRRNDIRIGKCHSIPHILDDGKIELFEQWQWLNGDKSKGTSIVIEK